MVRNHTHKLKRHTYKNGEQVFFCVLDCSYRIKRELALGKKAICHRCGQEFNIDEYALRLAKPHCKKCLKNKTEIELPVAVLTHPTVTTIRSELRNETDDLRARLLKSIGNSLDGHKREVEPNEDLLVGHGDDDLL